MQEKIRAVYMRGGSSKGLFFRQEDLPADPVKRDKFILAAYGSPDPNGRQTDGMGGATSTTSKVAIIGPPSVPGADVDYTFGQVSIDRPIVDYKGNCGNISSAVGPYAVDEGLVTITEPVTTVRIYQVNTKKIILSDVPVEQGKYRAQGDYVVDGVPGTGGKITLRFLNPGGAVTGKLLPTGKVKEKLSLPGGREIEVSIVDATNPVVFFRAAALGLEGREIDGIDENHELLAAIEMIRAAAAVRIGLAETPEEASARSQAVPKVAFVSPPAAYTTVSGRELKKEEMDLCARIMSMGKLHRAYALSGGVCTAGAACIEGTVVYEAVPGSGREEIRIGHPGGVMEIETVMDKQEGNYVFREARSGRTARRLMEGYVFVPRRSLEG